MSFEDGHIRVRQFGKILDIQVPNKGKLVNKIQQIVLDLMNSGLDKPSSIQVVDADANIEVLSYGELMAGGSGLFKSEEDDA